MAMRTRKEQVQAYRFVTRRLVAAMQFGEPETTEMPMRRLGLAVLGSIMLALIIGAVMGVIGYFNPGGGTPRAGVVIQEKETTAIYIYDEDDRVLYPVVNYASALLVLGTAEPEIDSMSTYSLQEYQRGRPIGIADAPASLPNREALRQDDAAWQVCSTPWNSSAAALATHVVNGNLSGGEELGEDAMLVTADVADGELYLLWNDTRLAIDKEEADEIRVALGMANAEPTEVSTAVLESIKAGPDLASPQLSGKDGVKVQSESTEVGDVFAVGEEHYVMTTGGLAPIGEVSTSLLTADGREVTPIDANTLADVLTDEPAEAEGFPQQTPEVDNMDTGRTALCATYRPGEDSTTTVTRYQSAPDELPENPEDSMLASEPKPGVAQVNQISVAGGSGVLVRSQPQPGAAAAGPVYLVTDQGLRYPVPSESKEALGYQGVKSIKVPGAILELLPVGPTMDPDAAQQPARDSGESD